ncbi:MAG: hypothetical protein AB8B56_04515 [Crocinitomicaceae bacterium]
MKKSLFAVTTALVLGSSIQLAHGADNIASQNTSQTDKTGYDWTTIQEIHGVSISYSAVIIGKERFLAVKFENTNSEGIDFIWSMTKNDASIVITEDEMIQSIVRLDASQSAIVDGSYLIALSEGDQFSDFTVSIQPTKR